jgi:hypothetical protein
MIKTKTKAFLLTMGMLIASLTMLLLSSAGTYAKIIKPDNVSEQLALSWQDGKLKITAPENANYEYQFWIKKKVETGQIGGVTEYQYIWQIVGDGYSYVNNVLVDVAGEDDIYLDEAGKYNVIARIKSGTNIVAEMYKAIEPIETGKTMIVEILSEGSAIEGNKIVIDKTELDIAIQAVNAETTALYYYNAKNPGLSQLIEKNLNGKYDISLAEGAHKILVRAQSQNSKDERIIDVYIIGKDYDTKPVITFLEEVSKEDNTVTFFMGAEHADGSAITAAEKNGLTFKLSTGGEEYIKEGADAVMEGDTLIGMQFTVPYGSSGIYYTVGEIFRTNKNAADDNIIIYYDGIAKPASVSISSTLGENVCTAVAETEITLTAEGEIWEGGNKINDADLRYAFYREDASGWVMIKDYPNDSNNGTLTWRPSRPGKYNIQARIRATSSGSYEAMATATFIITPKTGGTLANEPVISIKDLNGNSVDEVYAGVPYVISAGYEGEDVLYKYTLWSKNTNLIYLSQFSVSPDYIFVAKKPDNIKVTVRVISPGSYGYADKSKMLSIKVYAEKTIDDLPDVFAGEEIDYSNIFTGEGILYVDGTQVSGKTYTYNSSGDYNLKFVSGLTVYKAVQTVNIAIIDLSDSIEIEVSKAQSDESKSNGLYTGLLTVEMFEEEGSVTKLTKIEGETETEISLTSPSVGVWQPAAISDLTLGEQLWNVYIDNSKAYTISVVVATKVISTAQEFIDMYTYTDISYNYPAEPTKTTFSGYIILGNNIDGGTMEIDRTTASGIAWGPYTSGLYTGFCGTLDGRGYTIKGFKVASANGLIGYVGRGGTIKNIAFVDTDSTNVNTYNMQLLNTMHYGRIENVYIYSMIGFNTAMLDCKWTEIENFVIYSNYIGRPYANSTAKSVGGVNVTSNIISDSYTFTANVNFTEAQKLFVMLTDMFLYNDYKTNTNFLAIDWSSYNCDAPNSVWTMSETLEIPVFKTV